MTGEDFDKAIRYCRRATEVVTHNNEAWHYYSQINYEASKFYSIAFAESLQEQVLAAAASAAAGAGPTKSSSE